MKTLLFSRDCLKSHIFCFFGCLMLAMLLTMHAFQNQQKRQAALLSPGILRLHILAESNRQKDQNVKLEIRSLVLDYIKEYLDKKEGPVSAKLESKSDTIHFLNNHKIPIEAAINRHLDSLGFPYHAVLSFTHCYFPTRRYGNKIFPCGYYDTAQIILGSGQGHNWWCVLYPRLCLVAEAYDIHPAPKIPSPSARPDANCQTSSLINQKDQNESSASANPHPDLKISFRLLPGISFQIPTNANLHSPGP